MIVLNSKLVCSNCTRKTRKMGEAINSGYLCKKCSMKKSVKDRPKGKGWRVAFSDLFYSYAKSHHNNLNESMKEKK